MENVYESYLVIFFVLFYNYFWQSCSEMSDDHRNIYAIILGLYAAQYYAGLFLIINAISFKSNTSVS